MTIAERDAADALRSIEDARRRATELRGYAQAGSTLIAWGIVWLVCNLAEQADPVRGPTSWVIGIAAAVLWSVTRPGKGDLRVIATVAAVLALFTAIMILTGVRDPRLHGTLAALVVAGAYIVLGIWTGTRFAAIGLMLAGVALIGWFGFPAWLHLWLGIGGGGALIVSGLWLRRA